MNIAKIYLDPKTKKTISHYGVQSIFIIYVKKYNGRRRVTMVGSGQNIQDVIDAYHSTQIFEHDRKYLYHRMISDPVSMEEKILMDTGTKQGPILRDRYASARRINYKTVQLAAFKNIPISLMKSVNAFLAQGHAIGGTQITKMRLICILMSQFLELSDAEKLDFLARGDLAYDKQKLASGGISPKNIASKNIYDALGDEDDLL